MQAQISKIVFLLPSGATIDLTEEDARALKKKLNDLFDANQSLALQYQPGYRSLESVGGGILR